MNSVTLRHLVYPRFFFSPLCVCVFSVLPNNTESTNDIHDFFFFPHIQCLIILLSLLVKHTPNSSSFAHLLVPATILPLNFYIQWQESGGFTHQSHRNRNRIWHSRHWISLWNSKLFSSHIYQHSEDWFHIKSNCSKRSHSYSEHFFSHFVMLHLRYIRHIKIKIFNQCYFL